jgi:AraC family transcriptional regulator
MNSAERSHKVVRQPLMESGLISIAYVRVAPVSPLCSNLEVPDSNIMALPLSGIFAKHDGPGRHVMATANDAIFLPAGQPYRLSFPGCIGDQCLTFRFSAETLSKLFPQSLVQDRIDSRLYATSTLIPPGAMLARQLLWRRHLCHEVDILEFEEIAVALLANVLESAKRTPTRRAVYQSTASDARRLRQINIAKEAMTVASARRWTLSELAALAHLSSYHLAHVFRLEVGCTVYQYLLRARLAQALSKIVESDTDLITIALDCGFASHSHLTSRFGTLFGLTPQALRSKRSSSKLRALRKNLTA